MSNIKCKLNLYGSSNSDDAILQTLPNKGDVLHINGFKHIVHSIEHEFSSTTGKHDITVIYQPSKDTQ